MEGLTLQPDGCYVLTFRNHKNISDEEINEIFNKYGNVYSVRKSEESIPWVFIRYKLYNEAHNAFKELQSSNLFVIRIATSGRKIPDRRGSDRERSDTHKTDSRERAQMKANRSRNNHAERPIKDDDDDDEEEAVKGALRRKSTNRSRNNFAERSAKDDDDDDDDDDNDEVEAMRAALRTSSLHGTKKHNKAAERNVHGNREEAENHRGSCSNSPPRLNRRSGSNFSGGARPRHNYLEDEGPPKLIKASEFYGSAMQQYPYESGLACRAAFNEVWANHPLRGEIQLKEIIITNFRNIPSKKEVYDLCAGVKVLHASIEKSASRNMPFCRVLVATEEEANKLYELDGVQYRGSHLMVSSLEYILDDILE